MFAAKDLFFDSNTGGYQISRSVRTRVSASAYFNRTPASAGSRTTWTYSAWIKRGGLNSGYALFGCGANNTNDTICYFGPAATGDQIDIIVRDTSTIRGRLTTTASYRDPGSWYHIMVVWDSTNATSANRLLLYINGVQVTAFSTNTQPPQNTQSLWNSTQAAYIARMRDDTAYYFDGYMTEINFIDGQALTPSSFGTTSLTTGVWTPIKYAGTYGTNGFYLNFSDNSAATAAAIGKDSSGNGNNWTPNNISVTAGVTYDSMVDTPTPYGGDTGAGGEVRGNYAVLNVLGRNSSNYAITDGNLRASFGAGTTGTPGYGVNGSMAPSFKYYYEVYITTNSNANLYFGCSNAPATCPGFSATSWSWAPYSSGSNKYTNSTSTAYGSSPASNGVGATFGVAVDPVNGKIYVRDSSGWFASSDPVAGTNPMFSGLTGDLFPSIGMQSGSSQTTDASVNFGQRAFAYTAPSGYKALVTQNFSTPTIANGAPYMAATLYTGNGTNQTVNNSSNFYPDLNWIKSRSNAGIPVWVDSVRGGTKQLFSSVTNAEQTDANITSAISASGIALGNNSTGTGSTNQNAYTYVLWQWLAGAGVTSSNTDGNRTSTVSANPTAGFSVVTWTFSTSANNTIGHGLGVAPSFIIVKDRSSAVNWDVYHVSLGYTQRLLLNSTAAAAAGYFAAAPTSTVFSMTTAAYTNNDNIVAYCFSAITGYSSFGSYTGNGSTDGPFVYTGFRPRWVMIKVAVGATGSWSIWDTSRDPYNVESATLLADTSGAETSTASIDSLSNGFKCRSATVANGSGNTYIYAAFAENPFKYALAR